MASLVSHVVDARVIRTTDGYSRPTGWERDESTSTVSGVIAVTPASLFSLPAVTATAARALLTDSCTVPAFVLITGPTQAPDMFAMVGCADSRPRCCPESKVGNIVVRTCPVDYFSTDDGCCPS